MGLLDVERYAEERRTGGDPHGVKLREAVKDAQRGECPVCSLLGRQEAARLYWLAYEGLNERTFRQRVRRARGLCRRHFRMLYRVVTEKTFNLSGVAEMMRDLLEADRKALGDDSPRNARRRAQRMVKRLSADAACPLCVEARQSEERKVGSLIDALGEPVFRDLYLASAGVLCRPHLVAALAQEPSDDVLAVLLDKHGRVLDADIAALAEYTRKKHYEFAHEPKGDEQEAPLRAVEGYSGTWPI